VREALFSILGDIAGASVLDVYAGTGALGIEALSRGAARAVFVESGPGPLGALRRNLEALDLRDLAVIVATPLERARAIIVEHGPYDLVFADPPYADLGEPPTRGARPPRPRGGEAKTALSALVAARVLKEGARVVIEHAARTTPPPFEGLAVESSRVYGDTALTFYACGTA
jgi:16S rRNA G966 N2-methylase RsmD